MKVNSENLPLKPLYNFIIILLFILWQYGIFLTNNLGYKFHISEPFCLLGGGHTDDVVVSKILVSNMIH